MLFLESLSRNGSWLNLVFGGFDLISCMIVARSGLDCGVYIRLSVVLSSSVTWRSVECMPFAYKSRDTDS